jgi:hypothetical protein
MSDAYSDAVSDHSELWNLVTREESYTNFAHDNPSDNRSSLEMMPRGVGSRNIARVLKVSSSVAADIAGARRKLVARGWMRAREDDARDVREGNSEMKIITK